MEGRRKVSVTGPDVPQGGDLTGCESTGHGIGSPVSTVEIVVYIVGEVAPPEEVGIVEVEVDATVVLLLATEVHDGIVIPEVRFEVVMDVHAHTAGTVSTGHWGLYGTREWMGWPGD